MDLEVFHHLPVILRHMTRVMQLLFIYLSLQQTTTFINLNVISNDFSWLCNLCNLINRPSSAQFIQKKGSRDEDGGRDGFLLPG